MIEEGKTYLAKNQGRAIAPVTLEVIVVWVTDKDVYYRLVNSPIVQQTPIDRFSEIVGEK